MKNNPSSPESISSESPSATSKKRNITPRSKYTKVSHTSTKDSRVRSKDKYKRTSNTVEIKVSEISQIGKGLFLLESGQDSELIAQYSVNVINKEQAEALESAQIVRASDNAYLDAGGDDKWE